MDTWWYLEDCVTFARSNGRETWRRPATGRMRNTLVLISWLATSWGTMPFKLEVCHWDYHGHFIVEIESHCCTPEWSSAVFSKVFFLLRSCSCHWSSVAFFALVVDGKIGSLRSHQKPGTPNVPAEDSPNEEKTPDSRITTARKKTWTARARDFQGCLTWKVSLLFRISSSSETTHEPVAAGFTVLPRGASMGSGFLSLEILWRSPVGEWVSRPQHQSWGMAVSTVHGLGW